MNGKYTPGPWHYRPGGPSVTAEHPDTGYFATVADCGQSYALPDSEKMANARLIAAAPELVKALRRLYWVAVGHASDSMKITLEEAEGFPWAEAARAALEKAGVEV